MESLLTNLNEPSPCQALTQGLNLSYSLRTHHLNLIPQKLWEYKRGLRVVWAQDKGADFHIQAPVSHWVRLVEGQTFRHNPQAFPILCTCP
jgi:hypothetical protein